MELIIGFFFVTGLFSFMADNRGEPTRFEQYPCEEVQFKESMDATTPQAMADQNHMIELMAERIHVENTPLGRKLNSWEVQRIGDLELQIKTMREIVVSSGTSADYLGDWLECSVREEMKSTNTL